MHRFVFLSRAKTDGIGSTGDSVGRAAGGKDRGEHEDAQPLRCQLCSSTSCCIARTRPSSYCSLVPLEMKVDVHEDIALAMDDPSTVWYWQLVYGSATRARARVARTRGNEG